MKTSLLLASSALLGILGACSSSSSSPPQEIPGTTMLGGACTAQTDCVAGLSCGFQIASTCTATGACVAIGSCSTQTFCPCGGGSAFEYCTDGVHAPVAVTGTTSCAPASSGEGGSDLDSGAPSIALDSSIGEAADSGGTPSGDDSSTGSDSSTALDSSAPLDSSSTPPVIDASTPPGMDASTPPHMDASAPADAGHCGTLAPPNDPAGCTACMSGGHTCQANGCYGGYYCDTTRDACEAPPPSCP